MSASFLVLMLILDGVAVVIVAVVIIYVVVVDKINGKTNLRHQIVFFLVFKSYLYEYFARFCLANFFKLSCKFFRI